MFSSNKDRVQEGDPYCFCGWSITNIITIITSAIIFALIIITIFFTLTIIDHLTITILIAITNIMLTKLS